VHTGLEGGVRLGRGEQGSNCHRMAAGARPRRIQSLKTTVEPRSNDLGHDHQACKSWL
jgi:hypothetical protein